MQVCSVFLLDLTAFEAEPIWNVFTTEKKCGCEAQNCSKLASIENTTRCTDNYLVAYEKLSTWMRDV